MINIYNLNYYKTIIGLKSTYLTQHHSNVAYYVQLITEYFCPGIIDSIVYAAKIHDYGKISIPNEILNKPENLNDNEWNIMKLHPVIGVELFMLRNKYQEDTSIKNHEDEIINAILYHHERWDGNGYPNGLRKTEIPLTARIMAVADAYDAITTLRPYKRALSSAEAIDILVDNKEKQFDPDIVDIFIKQLEQTLLVGQNKRGILNENVHTNL